MKVRATIEVVEATEYLGDLMYAGCDGAVRGPDEGWTLRLPCCGKVINASDVVVLDSPIENLKNRAWTALAWLDGTVQLSNRARTYAADKLRGALEAIDELEC